MEIETDKTSYTLEHPPAEEEKKDKTESYEPLDEDAPAETDKMLVTAAAPDVKKSTEILPEANETTALEEKKEAIKEENQGPTPNVPIKNRFLQFFERKKPAAEPAIEAKNGTTVNTSATEVVDGAPANPKRKFISIKLQNPFAKKSEPATEPANPEKPTVEASSSDEKKEDFTEDFTVPAADDKKTETKFKPLASINFPNFSGIINKFRKTPRTDDIELGNGPGGKAGLASMETLDDSTKDPWNQENAPDAVDAETQKDNEKEKADGEKEDEKKTTIIESIQNYNCSIDDIALIAGIVVFFLLVGLIIVFTFCGNTKTARSAPIRDGKVLAVTSCGPVEGMVEDSAVAFRGIPYAKPPIGALRFEHAQVIDDISYCWNGTYLAHNSSTECLQTVNGKIEGSEDCLVLDVVTPEVRYINLLPVVVMIGSNDFNGGSPGIMRPSARYARSKDVIFVRPRFRLNVIGFLALESLSNSSNVPTSGNYGLSDIIAALEWIQINIKNFGGDPSSVTLFGHRAGATLVTALTSSTKASKLFARAWASSGSAHFSGNSLTENERENVEFAQSFPDCDDKTCWQKVESQKLVEKLPNSWKKDFTTSLPQIDEAKVHNFLVLDGIILKKHPIEGWKSDIKSAPKLVVGTTAHAAFDKTKPSAFSPNLTAADIRQIVSTSVVGQLNLTDEALELYGETVQGLIAMISDIRVVCPLYVLVRSQTSLPFYIVTQTQGDLNVADVDSDVQAILGRYSSESPEKRRYLDAIRQLFFYYVSHGKLNHYSAQNFILNIEQDVIPQADYPRCGFWIKNSVVPHYAAV